MSKRWGTGVEQFPLPPAVVPAANYSSPARLQLEIERVFRRGWLHGAMSAELTEPGQYKVWDKFGESVVIVRRDDGDLAAFHNVCVHRGAKIAFEDGICDRSFECKWHGFRYDHRGVVTHIPKRSEFDPAKIDGIAAMPVAVHEWHGIVWICLAGPDAAPRFDEYMGELDASDELVPFELSRMRLIHHSTTEFHANWKAALDGFNEAYHGATTHQVFIENQVFVVDQQVLAMLGIHDAEYLPIRRMFDQLQATEDHVNYAVCEYNLFPNTILLFNPMRRSCFVMMAWPDDIDRTLFEVYILVHPDADPVHDQEIIARQLAILAEDEFAMELSGATIRSMAYREHLLCEREGRLTHLAEVIQRFIDEERPWSWPRPAHPSRT